MKQPIYNDQAYIAERFKLTDDEISQSSALAICKIHSYKLSLQHLPYGTTPEELWELVRQSLLYYTDSIDVLEQLGFFNEMIEN